MTIYEVQGFVLVIAVILVAIGFIAISCKLAKLENDLKIEREDRHSQAESLRDYDKCEFDSIQKWQHKTGEVILALFRYLKLETEWEPARREKAVVKKKDKPPEKIASYEMSNDGEGLLRVFMGGEYIHIHSNELTEEEKVILNSLKHQKIK